MADIDKDFVEFVVKALVDNPDQVVIDRSVDERGVLLELTVAPEDMGKVIGKAGSTAKAIRTLQGTRCQERCSIQSQDY